MVNNLLLSARTFVYYPIRRLEFKQKLVTQYSFITHQLELSKTMVRMIGILSSLQSMKEVSQLLLQLSSNIQKNAVEKEMQFITLLNILVKTKLMDKFQNMIQCDFIIN